MPRRPRHRSAVRTGLAALLATFAFLGACSGGGEEPPAPEQTPQLTAPDLLSRSADAMSQVQTVHFDVTVDNAENSRLPVEAAQGSLTKEGDVQGNATMRQFGTSIELNFVQIGDQFWLEGPTGGYQEVPGGASNVYDASAILDNERGVPALLRNARDARIEGQERIAGTDTHRVSAQFSGQDIAAIVPGFNQDTRGEVWIAAGDPAHMLQARFPVDQATVTVVLSNFDEPVEITPPN